MTAICTDLAQIYAVMKTLCSVSSVWSLPDLTYVWTKLWAEAHAHTHILIYKAKPTKQKLIFAY